MMMTCRALHETSCWSSTLQALKCIYRRGRGEGGGVAQISWQLFVLYCKASRGSHLCHVLLVCITRRRESGWQRLAVHKTVSLSVELWFSERFLEQTQRDVISIDDTRAETKLRFSDKTAQAPEVKCDAVKCVPSLKVQVTETQEPRMKMWMFGERGRGRERQGAYLWAASQWWWWWWWLHKLTCRSKFGLRAQVFAGWVNRLGLKIEGKESWSVDKGKW